MSKEAKPIAVVYYDSTGSTTSLYELQKIMDDRWPDYHVLCVPVHGQERSVEVEVFYDKNFTETNYEDLKKWITDYIKPSPPTENKP